MCGITGYISLDKHNGKSMVNALHHRGPDSQGYLERTVGHRNVFLGHTRLSIIDLSDSGRQPMSLPNAQQHLVYNGEVYNFQALKEQFLKGISLRSSTDTEVILNLYHQLGLDFYNI